MHSGVRFHSEPYDRTPPPRIPNALLLRAQFSSSSSLILCVLRSSNNDPLEADYNLLLIHVHPAFQLSFWLYTDQTIYYMNAREIFSGKIITMVSFKLKYRFFYFMIGSWTICV